MKKFSLIIGFLSLCLSTIFAINHFVPVWSGNGFQHMNVFVTQAQIHDINMSENDEIAVFDGQDCVGMVKLSSPINQYIAFVASKDDPGTSQIDGFTNNNNIIFKIWDSDLQIEYSVPHLQVNYIDSNPVFLQGETIVVSLNVPVLTPKILTLTSNLANSVLLQGSGTYTPYNTVNINAIPNAGFSFLNWRKNNTIIGTTPQLSYIMPNESVTLQAYMERNAYQLSTSSIPENIGTLSGAGTYLYDAPVQLSANPPIGYSFIKWIKNDTDTIYTENYSFNMPAQNVSCTAIFQQNNYLLSVDLLPNTAGSVQGYGTYTYNQSVSLQAVPSVGYHFVAWKHNGITLSTNPLYEFLMPPNDLNIIAEFALNSHTLTMIANPPQAAQLFGAGTYDYGQAVNFSFQANPGYRFVNWTINNQIVVDTENYMFIVEDQDYQVTANFYLESYQLSVISDPLMAGSCTGDGIYQFTSLVQLSAAPFTGYHFSAWKLDGNTISNNSDYLFTMPPNNCHLTAFFEKNTHHVNVSTHPENAGTITGSGLYQYGDNIHLTVQSNPGYRFSHYLIDGVHYIDLADYYFILLDADVNVLAYFEYEDYYLSLIATPISAGIVNGSGNYHYTQNVEVSATPLEGYHFIAWKNNDQVLSTNAFYNFPMPSNDLHLEAFFEKNIHFVSVTASPSQGGSTIGSGQYQYGDQVNIQAIPNPGFHFVNWTINNQEIVAGSPYSFIMSDQDYTIQANFERNSYLLNVEITPDNSGTVVANTSYLFGQQVSLTAIPLQDYRFVHWKMNDQILSTNLTYNFNMPAQDVNITAVFVPVNYLNLPETLTFLEDQPITLNFNDYLVNNAYDLFYTTQNTQHLTVDIQEHLITIYPLQNWSGNDLLTFNIYQNSSEDDREQNPLTSVSMNIAVLPINDPPELIAPIQSININEDEIISSLDLNQYISDADLSYGDHLIFEVSSSSNLIVSNNQGLLSIQAIQDYYGIEEISITATDDSLSSVVFQIPLQILPVNDNPQIHLPESVSVDEDNVLILDLSPYISDVDNLINELSVSVNHSDFLEIEVVGLSLRIQPLENWSGSELITVTAYDDLGVTRNNINSQNSDQLLIIVSPLNDTPKIIQHLPDLTINEDQSLDSINLMSYFSDDDLIYSDNLSFRTHDYFGLTLNINNNQLNIAPIQDWFGIHEIEVIATDSHGIEVSDYMQITVNPVNDLPVLSLPDHFIGLEDLPLIIDILPYISDVDNDINDLSLIFNQNEHLSVSLNNHLLTVTPDVNWFGMESIQFILNDQSSSRVNTYETAQNVKTVNFTFNPVNDPPYLISNIPSITFNEDDIFSGLHLNDYFSDYDLITGDRLTFSASQHDGLDIQLIDDQVVITPQPNWYGSHYVTFTATDDSLSQISASVQVNILNVNDTPILTCPLSFTTNEDIPLTVDFSPFISDIDNELTDLMIVAVSSAHITAWVNNHHVSFTPSPNWSGNEIVSIQLSDGVNRKNRVHRSIAEISINVLPLNDLPYLTDTIPNISLLEDHTFNQLNLNQYFNDNDLNSGDHLTFSYSLHASISLQINDGWVTIVPSVNWSGNELITFTATDDSLQSVSTSVNLIVHPQNDPPFLIQTFSPLTFQEDSLSNTINLSNIFSDYDLPYGDHLTFSSSLNDNLNVTFSNNLLQVQALNNWSGQHTLSISATDDSLASVSTQLLVIVTPVNDAPNLNLPESITIQEDTPFIFDVHPYIHDVDNNNFSMIINDSPNLTATVSGLTCHLLSHSNWNGITYLTLTVTEAANRLSVTDSVQIIVAPVNDAPVNLLPESITFEEDSVYILDLSPYIYDIDSQILSISISESPFLNYTIDNYIIQIHPEQNYFGQSTIFVSVNDMDSRLITTDSLIVNVLPVNDSLEIVSYFPSDLNQSLYTLTNYSFTVNAFDADNDSLSYTWMINDINQNNSSPSLNTIFTEQGFFVVKVIVSDGLTLRDVVWNVSVNTLSSDGLHVFNTQLINNYPNPFNPDTFIRFSLKESDWISIEIFNVKGQKVKQLLNQKMNVGFHSLKWDGTDDNNRQLCSGVYFYKMRSSTYSGIKKMLMLK